MSEERPDHNAAARTAEVEIRDRIVLMAGKDKPVMWSRSAYTHRRTEHTQFLTAPCKDVRRAVEVTVEAVNAYRNTIDGPVLLTWRIEPEVEISDEGVSVYVRLCFEPDLWSGQ